MQTTIKVKSKYSLIKIFTFDVKNTFIYTNESLAIFNGMFCNNEIYNSLNSIPTYMWFLENSDAPIKYLHWIINHTKIRIRLLDVKYFPICHQYYSLESGYVTDW